MNKEATVTGRTRARGELEQRIMNILWATGEPMSATDVQAAFSEPVPAYTTVMTSLGRLERKGQVLRSDTMPRKVRFTAAHSQQEHASDAMMSALGQTTDRTATLLRFAGNLDAADVAALRDALMQHTPPNDADRR